MSQTHQDYIDDIYEQFGGAARFIDLDVSAVDQKSQTYDAEFLEWHGHSEVAGTNGNLAGVLIDEETVMLLDMGQERIIRIGYKGIIAMTHKLRREHDETKQAKIMALYHKLVIEHLKQHYKAAG